MLCQFLILMRSPGKATFKCKYLAHRWRTDESGEAGILGGGEIEEKGLMDMDNSEVIAGGGGYKGTKW